MAGTSNHRPFREALGQLMDRMGRRLGGQVMRAAEVETFFYEDQGISPAYWQLASDTDFAKQISGRLVGQPHAVHALSDLLELLSSRLDPPGKPISSLLFIGPTGVGKTEAAKVLCRCMLGDEALMHRFDMSEYIDEGAVDRLIGSWANPEGQLTSRIRYRPYGVLLLDEVEKAHPKVLDLLLQVLDEGRLSDANGRTTFFHNLVIIMTSNLGVEEASHRLGFAHDKQQDDRIYEAAVERFFRPEFVNRIDQLVIFKPLQKTDVHRIAQLQIKDLLRRDGFLRRTTLLTISKDALEWVSERGYDPKMGGRALKRQIERDLTTLSADQLLQLSPEIPVLLEIGLQEGQLNPMVEPLALTGSGDLGWIPDFPLKSRAGKFIHGLIKQLEKLEDQIHFLEEGSGQSQPFIGRDAGQQNWGLYHYKERVASCLEDLRHKLAGMHDHGKKPPIALRFKEARLEDGTGALSIRDHHLGAKLFEPGLIQQLSSTYKHGIPIWDQWQSEMLLLWTRAKMLGLEFDDVRANHMDRLKLQIVPRVSEGTKDAIAYLADQYKALFQALDLSHSWHPRAGHFTLEGLGVRNLLAAESGIHMFFSDYQSPIPLQVMLEHANGKNRNGERPSRVIRLYHEYQYVTDMRTATTCKAPLSASEYQLLLLAGLLHQKRKASPRR